MPTKACGMSKKLRDVAARFRGRVDQVLAGDSWGGFPASSGRAGSAGGHAAFLGRGAVRGPHERRGPPPTAGNLVLEAEGSFADFQKEHGKFFKSLTALKAFPVKDLRVARMDALKLGGSVPAWELGFEELELRGEVSRPYVVLQCSPSLPDVPAQALAGVELELDDVHGQVYDLYKGGRPFAELERLSFGKVKGKNLECTLELRLRLAEAAHHNPDHRYKDATVKLKTRIPFATGFV